MGPLESTAPAHAPSAFLDMLTPQDQRYVRSQALQDQARMAEV